MATYPVRELEIVRLAQDVSIGLAAHREQFPAPPAPSDELDRALAAYNTARENAKAGAASAAEGAAQTKEALKALSELVKADIKYAESMARGDQSRLAVLGWGPRRDRTFNDEGPGQVAALEVREEGKTWIRLKWKQPLDGAPVTAYRVQRRKPGAEWVDVGTAVGIELTLNGQDTGVEFEYQVLAINKFGPGIPSNIVRAVLA